MVPKRIGRGAVALVFSLAALLRQLQALAAPLAGGAAPVPSTMSVAGAATPVADPRAAYFAGRRAGDSAERRRQYAAGIAAARARLASNPDDPEGLLWLAANLGSEALERGKLFALKVLPEMERTLLRLEQTAPLHDHAAAARTLASLYFKAPAVISIGSNAKARLYFGKALARAGDYPANLALAAEFFADRGEDARAAELAARYLRAPVPAAEFPDAPAWKRMAEKIAGKGKR